MRVDAPARRSGTAPCRRPVLAPDSTPLLAAAGDLAVEFATSGSGRIEAELVRFVDAAQRLGADALLGSIVLDRSEPDVVRQRAFGAMHRQVAGPLGAA